MMQDSFRYTASSVPSNTLRRWVLAVKEQGSEELRQLTGLQGRPLGQTQIHPSDRALTLCGPDPGWLGEYFHW